MDGSLTNHSRKGREQGMERKGRDLLQDQVDNLIVGDPLFGFGASR